MALLANIEKIRLERNTVHEPVDATYTAFQSEAGDIYLQIDAYGSAHRALKGKKSQSIQLNREMARTLMAILRETFGP